VIGVWGFQRSERLVWAWPLAVVLSFGAVVALTAVLPGGHGFCE
jgi:hypothetical protein